jgi:hypothetical protein
MYKYIIYTILLGIFVLSIFLNFKSCQSDRDNKYINEVIKDSLHITKNKLNQQTTTTRVLVADRNILKQQNDSMYLRIRAIDRYYRRKLIAVTSLDLVTIDTSKGKTNILSRDTIRKGNIVEIYPEYNDTIEKKLNGQIFATYQVKANKDSIEVISNILNPIDIDYRYNKKNFFDRKHLVVDVKTINPNSGVVQMKSYMPPTKKSKLPNILIGISLILGILLGHYL